MCAVSVGGLEDVYSDDGVYAPIEDILFPIHRGIFAFTGFSVIAPFVVYGPGRISAAERETYLRDYVERLLTLDTAPILGNDQRADRAGFSGTPAGKR